MKETILSRSAINIYKIAFNDAISQGVEVIILVVSWNVDGEATFVSCDLPVNL